MQQKKIMKKQNGVKMVKKMKNYGKNKGKTGKNNYDEKKYQIQIFKGKKLTKNDKKRAGEIEEKFSSKSSKNFMKKKIGKNKRKTKLRKKWFKKLKKCHINS